MIYYHVTEYIKILKEETSLERKPIFLEKEKFEDGEGADGSPLQYDNWINNNINIKTEEKNELAPAYDYSDNFWDDYIKYVNRIQRSLDYISNNFECITGNQDYIKTADEADDFCNFMIQKISSNDRDLNGIDEKLEYFLEQTKVIVNHIKFTVNYNAKKSAEMTEKKLKLQQAAEERKARIEAYEKKHPKKKKLEDISVLERIYWILLAVSFGAAALIIAILHYGIDINDNIFWAILLFAVICIPVNVLLSLYFIPYRLIKSIKKLLSKLSDSD